MPRFRAALVVVFTLAMGALPASADFYDGNGFTLNLPSEWVEIPLHVVRKQMKETPGAQEQAPHVEAAFQLKKDQVWFTYPYIVVTTFPNPTKGQPSIATMKGVVKQMNTQPGASVSLDEKNAAFRGTISQSFEGIGVKGSVNGHFGKNKLVRVEGYALAPNYSGYEPQFLAIDNTFNFKQGEEYNQAMASGQRVGRYGMYGLIAIVVGVVIRLIKKRTA